MIAHLLLFAAAGACSGALTAHSAGWRAARDLVRAALAGAGMGALAALTVRGG